MEVQNAAPEVTAEVIATEEPSQEAQQHAQASANEPADTSASTEQEKPQESDSDKDLHPRTNKRIRDLIAQRDEARAEAQRLKAAISAKPAPTLEEFDHDMQRFTEAVVDHRTEQAQVNRASEQADQMEQTAEAILFDTWGKMKAEAAKTYPDFDKVFGDDVPVTKTMAEALVYSDNPTDVAYYLGKNRDEAARIARLPPHMQGYEIAKLEAKAKPMPVVTNAPEPAARRVSGGGAPAKTYEGMSWKEFCETRAKEQDARRR